MAKGKFNPIEVAEFAYKKLAFLARQREEAIEKRTLELLEKANSKWYRTKIPLLKPKTRSEIEQSMHEIKGFDCEMWRVTRRFTSKINALKEIHKIASARSSAIYLNADEVELLEMNNE